MRLDIGFVFVVITSTAAMPSKSAVNDIFPADFVPLPPETYVATTYFFDKQSEGPYSGGEKVADWKIRSQSAVFRLAKFKEWDGTVVAGSFVAGVTQQSLSGLGVPSTVNEHASGLRDIRFNGTAWLVNKPSSREYFAVNATWLLPTGQYKYNEVQNIGENRHQLALTFAWLRGFGDRWNFEVIGEMAGYSKNKNYYPGKVTQDKSPTRAITSYLRYEWKNGFETYLGYEWNRGGGTAQNGSIQNDKPNHDRSMIGLIYPINQTNIVNFRVSKDANVLNGFGASREVSFRWLNFF